MTSFENERDLTVWDPNDPEQAIEDLIHGSEAILRCLDTPPMPLDDGTFWVFGASSFVNTCTFDGNGKPFIKLGFAIDPAVEMQQISRMKEWFDQIESGELPEIVYPEFDFTARPYFVLPE